MNGTPRLRSAYPYTPRSGQKDVDPTEAFPGPKSVHSSLSPVDSPNLHVPTPMIPFDVVDAPSQRLYVLMFYACLWIWRISDYLNLISDETESLWLFMKWLAIDSIFLYGLPEFQIPWLQWSSSTTALLVVLHTFFNVFLMFRIPIPLTTWLLAVTRLLYDRELAVSERSVKPASILYNSSLILGKQIIHKLNEGSAVLNPDRIPLCISPTSPFANLPIHINQTNPIAIQILRVNINTNINETINLTNKEIKKLRRQADKDLLRTDNTSIRILQYPVKEPGLYRLQRVVDQSKLEVLRRISDTVVVECPTAMAVAAPHDKCRGDLSDFYLRVKATPPIKIKYSKVVNRDDCGHAVLSIHPENLTSPLAGRRTSDALTKSQSQVDVDVSWARSQSINIPLNESLGVVGGWQYTIDEVEDACGNVANYSLTRALDQAHQKQTAKGRLLQQHFSVHGRPRVALLDHDPHRPIKIAKGTSKLLPIQLKTTESNELNSGPATLSYTFTPQDDLDREQRHSKTALVKDVTIDDADRGFEVQEPGLYTLRSISTQFCDGEVMEPSSCVVINPLEPDLTISAENIPDRCAGNSIGLLVDLDLLGTPPFQVFYTIRHREGGVTRNVDKIDRLHSQIELRPSHAGHYTYKFTGISDAVYQNPRSLAHKNLALEQDVRPPAAARILNAEIVQKACIEEPLTFNIQMIGESPYTLDYEIIHRGRRQKNSTEGIESNRYDLTTQPLKDGGEHTLALTSVTDKSGCKVFLKAEAKFDVGLQRPRAAFGHVENQRSVLALEDRKVALPLRLQGERPWKVSFRNLDDGREHSVQLHDSNDHIEVNKEGEYEIYNVSDVSCPGSVDSAANRFTVRWIPRPSMRVAESSLIRYEQGQYVKREICEGDEDVTEVSFTGTAPFYLEYEQLHKSDRGLQSMSIKKLSAGLSSATVRMETQEAGSYQYKFSQLGDSSYNHDHRKFSPVIVQQRVSPRPSAYFSEAGKNYRYCKEEDAGGESIPITLTGKPPFHLELELKHHTMTRPELINIPNIPSNHYKLHIPHRLLALGTYAVTIRKVSDSRGCQRKIDFNPPHVQVSVSDIPSISPLEDQTHYCVGDRISYALSGTPPFNVYYTFQDHERKASVSTTDFRRIAERPGLFVVTALSDQRSTDLCKAKVSISKEIHEMPSVRVSKGRTATIDIPEGGEAEILFEFGGAPPFHFTFTRSTTPPKGGKVEVLETKNEISYEYSKTIRASDEGLYEVVSIRDRFCSFSIQNTQGRLGQKFLKNQ